MTGTGGRDAAPVPWSAADLPDLEGRTFVVTGASSGLGLITARELARRRATVVMAVRDTAKGEEVRAQVLTSLPQARLEVRLVDLLDLDSVRRFADALRAEHTSIDVLVNNAGISNQPRWLSPQGQESQFAVNHLGHFALTGLLLDLLQEGSRPRVVSIGTNLYRRVKTNIDFDDLTGEHSYSRTHSYIQSKVAAITFGDELDRRLQAAGSPIRSLIAHPGMAKTPSLDTLESMRDRALMAVMKAIFARSAEQGAAALLFAAAAPEAPAGLFLGPGTLKFDRRIHKDALRPPADDHRLAARLWVVSEELTGVSYLSAPAGV